MQRIQYLCIFKGYIAFLMGIFSYNMLNTFSLLEIC